MQRLFDRQGLHQPDQGHLGRAIVGLAEIAVEAGRGCGHDDAAIALLAHDLPDRLGAVDRPHQVDVDDEAEILQLHLGEGLVAQDTGVVDQDVDPAPARHRRLDHGLDGDGVGHRGGIGHGLAPQGDDFSDNRLGGTAGSARSVPCPAEVVDDDAGPAGRQGEGVRTPESTTRSGYDRDPTFETHCHLSFSRPLPTLVTGVSSQKTGICVEMAPQLPH